MAPQLKTGVFHILLVGVRFFGSLAISPHIIYEHPLSCDCYVPCLVLKLNEPAIASSIGSIYKVWVKGLMFRGRLQLFQGPIMIEKKLY